MKKIYVGEEILPAFTETNAIVCAFELTERYVPYFDVFLKSFLIHASSSNNYDLILFSTDITPVSENILLEQIQNKKHISIRFFDPSDIVEKYIAENRNYYLNLNYFRLALPWILKNYDKALNLGVDMLLLKDISDLFHTSLDDNTYLAGVRDLDYVGRLNIDIPPSELGLMEPHNYINADVVLFNLKQIRNHFSVDEVFDLWKHYPFRLAEQDVINSIFEKHILFLDGRWNVFPKGMISDDRIQQADIQYQKEWDRVLLKPYIIHFAGTPKPWDNPEIGYGFLWWQYAMESCFYAVFLYQLMVRTRDYRKPFRKRITEAILPKNPERSKRIKRSAVWKHVRHVFRIIIRDSDIKKFGRRGKYID